MKQSMWKMVFRMITEHHLKMLNPAELVAVDEEYQIMEKDDNEKFIMNLSVKKSGGELYSIFCNQIKSKKNDYSRITFLKNSNFPDGIFLEVKSDGLIFHVIELKRSPVKQLNKLERQFMGAYLHIKSLVNIWNIVDFKIKYYVCFINDEKSIETKYIEKTGFIKGIPGQEEPQLPIKVLDWYKSKINTKFGSIDLELDLTKISCTEAKSSSDFEVFNSLILI